MKILSQILNTGAKRRFVGWCVFYFVLAAIALVFAYKAGQELVTHQVPVGKIQLSVSKKRYKLGEVVRFTVKNEFSSTIYISNSCPQEPLTVYKWDGKSWQRIHDTASAKSCSSQERRVTVPSNSSTDASYARWHHLFNSPGLYRIVAVIDNYKALPYADFEILRPPIVKSAPPSNISTNKNEENDNAGTAAQPSDDIRKSRTVTTSGGTIKVQYDDTLLYVISITPASGCGYEKSVTISTLEVAFKCGENEIHVLLYVQNGQLLQQIVQGDD